MPRTVVTRRTRFDIACDEPSRWSVSFERNGDNIEIGLHFNEKELPTHGFTLAVSAFADLTEQLLR